jgi:zinc protease
VNRALCFSLLSLAAAFAQKVPSLPGMDEPPPPAVKAPPAARPPAATTKAPVETPASAPPAASAPARPRAAAPPASGPSPRDLKFPPPRVIQVAPLASINLPNGMKLYLQEDRELPVITGTLLVRTGSAFDPPERIGLAQLTGTLLRTGGTALKTGEQVDEILDGLAGAIETSMGETQANISFFALKENSEAVLMLLKEMLAQPGFRQDKLDQARVQLRNAISHRNDNAGNLTEAELRHTVYGADTPYGWQQQLATIDRISRADVRSFYQRYYFPANLILGIRGDFDSAEMKASVERMFADWTVQQKPVPDFPKVKNAPAPGVFLAEKKDITQTFFAIGQLGIQQNSKAYAALEVMANILGGPTGRLAEHARVKMGNPTEFKVRWTTPADRPGIFQITGSTRSISTIETVKAVREEIERMRTTEVSEDELRLAREAALSSALFAFDSKTKLFSALLGYEYYGYPKDFLQSRQKALQAVTRADILRAAKESVTPENLSVVVTGNPTLFGDSLARLGTITKLDLTIPASKPELAVASDASLAHGKEILGKAQAAAGGADRLASIRDYSMLAEYQIATSVLSVGGTKIIQTDRWVAPTTFRQDSTLVTGRVSAYTDGRIGWIATPQGWGALTGPQGKQVYGDLFRVYFRLLLSDRLEGRSVNAIDDTTVQISDAAGQVASVEFDPQTGLIRRISYDTVQAAGPPLYSEELYEDFRDIGGVKVPFKITINQGGRKFSDVVVTEYKINVGIRPIDLAKRPQ